MNSIQENKASMYFKVRAFFVSNLSSFSTPVPSLTAVVGSFNTKLDELGTRDMAATEDISGYAVQKEVNRIAMRDKALTVAGGIRAWALGANDHISAKKATVTKSDLDKMRDTDALYFCERLHALADNSEDNIIPFGVTTAMITAFNTAITNFKTLIQQPAEQRSEGAASGKAVDRIFTEIDAILLRIDGMMDTQALTQPVLYAQYKLDRMIDDNTSGEETPPDIVMTIESGTTVNVFTVPYVASRSFKAKNKSDFSLKWGLSNDAAAFTSEIHDLAPLTTSVRLSSTLAENGDNLLFQNDNPESAEIEVTVFE